MHGIIKYTRDAAGNITNTIIAGHNEIWKADYTPLGKATIAGCLKFNLRADGQYQDDETGLYYNWYRYYNPDLGRYITSDPLGLAAWMNT